MGHRASLSSHQAVSVCYGAMKSLQPKCTFLFKLVLSRAMLVAAMIAAAGLPVAAQTPASKTAIIDQVLQDAVNQGKVPGVVAMVTGPDNAIYKGAFGKRDTTANLPMEIDSIFRIASMTKPITSVAVMQLVEQGRIKLDEPVATYLPELSHLRVLDTFDSTTGQAKLRAPKTPPTVRQLLTHTSGFVYDFSNATLSSYAKTGAVPSTSNGDDGFLKAPLLFDPGLRWEYGISCDWLGKLVEKVSGQNLEDYFHRHIFEPLGMTDTFFNVPADKQTRVVALYQRLADGSLAEVPPQPLKAVSFFSGGGGLYSTAGDYVKFMRMVLDGGKAGNSRVLMQETVTGMIRNQIGDLQVVDLPSQVPMVAVDPIRSFPVDKFGFGFGINSEAVEGGRSAGSLAWAGIFNTFFWIDPTRKVAAVIMMQMLPYGDKAPKAVAGNFEHAVYAQ